MTLYNEIKQTLDTLGIEYKENLCGRDLAIRGDFKNTTAFIDKIENSNEIKYGIMYSSKITVWRCTDNFHTIIAYLNRFYFEKNLSSP